MENKGENKLIGKWIIRFDNSLELVETFKDDCTFISEVKKVGHTFKGHYSYDTTVLPHTVDLIIEHTTLENIPLGLYKGIFAVENNIYKSCTRMPEQERPLDFDETSVIAEKLI